jgi:hypothetical protein
MVAAARSRDIEMRFDAPLSEISAPNFSQAIAPMLHGQKVKRVE